MTSEIALEQLEKATRQVAECERMIAGWRALIHTVRAEGRDVTVARDLLETFERKLEAQRAVIQQMIAEGHG